MCGCVRVCVTRYVLGALRAKCWACFRGFEGMSDASLKTLSFTTQEMRRVRRDGGTIMRVAGERVQISPHTALFATYTIRGGLAQCGRVLRYHCLRCVCAAAGTYMSHHENMLAKRLGSSFRTLLLLLPHAPVVAEVRLASLGYCTSAISATATNLVHFVREVCSWRLPLPTVAQREQYKGPPVVGTTRRGTNGNGDGSRDGLGDSITYQVAHNVGDDDDEREVAAGAGVVGAPTTDDATQRFVPLLPWSSVQLLQVVLSVMRAVRVGESVPPSAEHEQALIDAGASITLSNPAARESTSFALSRSVSVPTAEAPLVQRVYVPELVAAQRDRRLGALLELEAAAEAAGVTKQPATRPARRSRRRSVTASAALGGGDAADSSMRLVLGAPVRRQDSSKSRGSRRGSTTFSAAGNAPNSLQAMASFRSTASAASARSTASRRSARVKARRNAGLLLRHLRRVSVVTGVGSSDDHEGVRGFGGRVLFGGVVCCASLTMPTCAPGRHRHREPSRQRPGRCRTLAGSWQRRRARTVR